MSRKYRIVHNIEEIEQTGREYGGWIWFEHYIPRDYKEHEYPAFIEWEEPWDGHEHGYWSWLPVTMEKYAELRLAEIQETKEELIAEINQDYKILDALRHEEMELNEKVHN